MRRARWAGANSMATASPPPASRSFALTAVCVTSELGSGCTYACPGICRCRAGTGVRRLAWFRSGTSPATKCLTVPEASAATTLLTGSTHAASAAFHVRHRTAPQQRQEGLETQPPSTRAGNRRLRAPPSGPPAMTGPRAVSIISTSTGRPPRTRMVSVLTTAGSQPSGPRASMTAGLEAAGSVPAGAAPAGRAAVPPRRGPGSRPWRW